MAFLIRKSKAAPKAKEPEKAKPCEKAKSKEPKGRDERETEFIFIVDGSRSMQSIVYQAVNYVNDTISALYEASPTFRLTLIVFGTDSLTLLWRVPSVLIDDIDLSDLQKGYGSTATLDALGDCFVKFAMEAPDSRAYFILVTDEDGENSSKRFSYADIQGMIAKFSRHRDYHFAHISFYPGASLHRTGQYAFHEHMNKQAREMGFPLALQGQSAYRLLDLI